MQKGCQKNRTALCNLLDLCNCSLSCMEFFYHGMGSHMDSLAGGGRVKRIDRSGVPLVLQREKMIKNAGQDEPPGIFKILFY